VSSVAAQDVKVLQPGADGIAWLSLRQQFGAELARPLMPVWDGKASKQLLLKALQVLGRIHRKRSIDSALEPRADA
jgi:hypothetical protein